MDPGHVALPCGPSTARLTEIVLVARSALRFRIPYA